MSIAFDKRDYIYDYDEGSDPDFEEDPAETSPSGGRITKGNPAEWVYGLLETIQRISKFHGDDIFDNCTALDLANFTSEYRTDSFEIL